jgi:hypothetical protein
VQLAMDLGLIFLDYRGGVRHRQSHLCGYSGPLYVASVGGGRIGADSKLRFGVRGGAPERG